VRRFDETRARGNGGNGGAVHPTGNNFGNGTQGAYSLVLAVEQNVSCRAVLANLFSPKRQIGALDFGQKLLTFCVEVCGNNRKGGGEAVPCTSHFFDHVQVLQPKRCTVK
jgi:hypothetical protein